MDLRQGAVVSRYTLNGPLQLEANGGTTPQGQLCLAKDEYDVPLLLKLWPFDGNKPPEFQRALWDKELRNLYRLGSSPGAEQSLVVITDAGIAQQEQEGCFFAALRTVGSGYFQLSAAFGSRAKHPWLTNCGEEARADLWRGFRILAAGLRLLHKQNILHRDLAAEGVFFDPNLGPTSFRLGGFEWTVRMGAPEKIHPTNLSWSAPPEFFGERPAGFTPETDWFAFGMLALRCLLNIEDLADSAPAARQLGAMERLGATEHLRPTETTFLVRLLEPDPRDRLVAGFEVDALINDIVVALGQTRHEARAKYFLLVFNPRSCDALVDAARSVGYEPEPGLPDVAFRPDSETHVNSLKKFVREDLSRPQVYAMNESAYVIVGDKLDLYAVGPYEESDWYAPLSSDIFFHIINLWRQ